MSDCNLQTAFIEKGCLPHQAEFASAFFAADSARKHLLVSAPGLGKGYVVAAIVNYALSTGVAHHVLVLADRSDLVNQWQAIIRRVNPDLPVMVIDRRRYRELEDSCPVGDSIWPVVGVVILALDFASQPDVADALARSPLDLLVIDEVRPAPRQTHRAKFLLDVVDRPKTRVLALQAGGLWTKVEIDDSSSLFQDAAVTIWSGETLRDDQGKRLLPEVRLEWVVYKRPAEELEVLAQLQNAARSLNTTTPQMRLFAASLLQSASSSPFALEQRLLRIRQRRNDLVHNIEINTPSENEAAEVGMDEPEMANIDELARGVIQLSSITESLSKMLEDLPSDSKCDALMALLNDLDSFKSPEHRVCVFTKFVDTATYLASTLQEVCSQVMVITGSSSFVERDQKLAEFVRDGGVLIATEAVEAPFPEVAAVIFYDIPLSPTVLESRIGRFVRIGRLAPRIVAFMDESNALVIERLQRRIADFKESFSESEIQRALFSDAAELLPQRPGKSGSQ